MAYARVSYLGDGSTKIFTVPFPYIDSSHVEIRVGGVLKVVTTDYTWLTSSTIQFVTAPATPKAIYILRNTPKQTRLVNYQDAAVLREADLDLDSDQSFYIVQEALDAAENTQAIETFVGGVDYTAGVTTQLTLGAGDIEMSNILVLFDGAAQHQTEYTESGGVITFDSAIPTGVLQVQVSYATPMTSGLINGSVTTPVLADLNVTTAKLADLGVTEPKLAQDVFHALTAVAAATGDYIPVADASDSNKKKKVLVSSILSLIQAASTSVAGISQLATIAQTTTYTGSPSSSVVCTPASLTGSRAYSFSGYQQLPGGLLVQWGRTGDYGNVSSGVNAGTVAFPLAFPNAVMNVVMSCAVSAASSGAMTVSWDIGSTTNSILAFDFEEFVTRTQTNTYFTYIAIGY